MFVTEATVSLNARIGTRNIPGFVQCSGKMADVQLPDSTVAAWTGGRKYPADPVNSLAACWPPSQGVIYTD
jgi:hypothetical protein